MIRITHGLVWLILCLALLGADSEPPAEPPAGLKPAVRSRERYDVVVQRNVFTRRMVSQASPPVEPVEVSETPPLPPSSTTLANLGQYWILTGTALMDHDRVAFLEDTRSGATLRVRDGQVIEAGRVLRIGAEDIELDADGRVLLIPIGSKLDGGLSDAPPPPTDEPNPAPVATAAPVPAPPSVNSAPVGEASLLERMRARRNQELSNR